MRFSAWAGGLLIVLIGGFAEPMQPTSDPRVQKILDDWKERLNSYKSIRYKLSGTAEEVGEPPIPEQMKGEVIRPAGPKSYAVGAVVLVDLVNGRVRLEETDRRPSRSGDRWVSEHRVSAFNGKVHQTSLPRDRNDIGPNDPDLAISRGNLSYKQIDSHLWPVFMAHGVVPVPTAPLRVDRLPIGHSPEEFVVAGSVTHDGRACSVLKTEPGTHVAEIWVDPHRASAISRYTRWTGKNPTIRLDVRYREAPPRFLADGWTQTTTVGGKVMHILKMKVDVVEVDVPVTDEDYTLPVRPGMLVAEYEYPPKGGGLNPSRPSQKTYRVGEDGGRATEGEQRGFTTFEGVELPPEPARRWSWWAAGLGGIALLAGGWWGWQRFRRRGAASGPGRGTVSG